MCRNVTLAYACVGHLAVHLLLGLHATAALAIARDGGLGVDYADLVTLWTLGAFLLGAAAPLAGWLADRVGTARMMVLFFVGCGAASIACSATTSPMGLGAMLAALGLFAAIYHPVALAWLVAGIGGKCRGWAVGLSGAFGSLGVAAAPLVAGSLAEVGGWRLAYLVPGVNVMAVGLLLAVRTRRHGAMPEHPRFSVGQARAAGPDRVAHGRPIRPLLALGVAMLCNSVLYAALTTALPKWTEGRLTDAWPGADLSAVGIATSAVLLVGSLGQLLTGWLADRFDPRALFLVALAAKPPLLLIAALTVGMPGLFAMAMLVSVIDVASPSESLLLARWVPDHKRGFTFGLRHAAALAATPLGVWLAAEAAKGSSQGSPGDLDRLLLLLAGLAMIATAAASGLPRSKATPRGLTLQPSSTGLSDVPIVDRP